MNTEYRSYNAEAAVAPFIICKPGANDMSVVPATAATDFLLGTSDSLTKAINEMVDLNVDDVAEVVLGATVARGAPLTSNASGQAITAAPTAGANVRIIGFAEVSGVSGDVITYHRSPGFMQG